MMKINKQLTNDWTMKKYEYLLVTVEVNPPVLILVTLNVNSPNTKPVTDTSVLEHWSLLLFKKPTKHKCRKGLFRGALITSVM